MIRANPKTLQSRATLWSTGLISAGVLVALCRPAYAYVDPGTGGLIVQLLLGGVAGAAVIAKLYWEKITGMFRRKPTEAPDGEQRQGASQSQDAHRE